MDGKLRNMTAIYVSQNEKMLLLYRIGSRVVEPCYCGIGGHFEENELNDARACVLRELKEEMHIGGEALEGLRMRYVTLRMKKGEIRQNYYFFAELKPDVEVMLSCDEGKPEWVEYDQLLSKNMPHTAWYMMRHYLEIGRYTDSVYAGVAAADGVCFTEMKAF